GAVQADEQLRLLDTDDLREAADEPLERLRRPLADDDDADSGLGARPGRPAVCPALPGTAARGGRGGSSGRPARAHTPGTLTARAVRASVFCPSSRSVRDPAPTRRIQPPSVPPAGSHTVSEDPAGVNGARGKRVR